MLVTFGTCRPPWQRVRNYKVLNPNKIKDPCNTQHSSLWPWQRSQHRALHAMDVKAVEITDCSRRSNLTARPRNSTDIPRQASGVSNRNSGLQVNTKTTKRPRRCPGVAISTQYG